MQPSAGAQIRHQPGAVGQSRKFEPRNAWGAWAKRRRLDASRQSKSLFLLSDFSKPAQDVATEGRSTRLSHERVDLSLRIS
eukprot:2876408-Pleurochrysis_carterae.AAC.1